MFHEHTKTSEREYANSSSGIAIGTFVSIFVWMSLLTDRQKTYLQNM